MSRRRLDCIHRLRLPRRKWRGLTGSWKASKGRKSSLQYRKKCPPTANCPHLRARKCGLPTRTAALFPAGVMALSHAPWKRRAKLHHRHRRHRQRLKRQIPKQKQIMMKLLLRHHRRQRPQKQIQTTLLLLHHQQVQGRTRTQRTPPVKRRPRLGTASSQCSVLPPFPAIRSMTPSGGTWSRETGASEGLALTD